jgi:RNA polymerase sigma-70 factor, ECF subfamily
MCRAEPEIDWESVYWEQLPRIYNFLRYRLCDEQLAEDLTATTFEKAWRCRARYDQDRGEVSTWLFTIAKNTAKDELRTARPTVSLDEVPEIADSVSVETLVEQRADLEHLAQLVQQLDDRERELISFKYGADLTNRTIAKLTGLEESNVGVILHRARGKIRALWETMP